MAFLRGCKFSLERTKEKIDMYYTCKTACPDLFENWDVKDPVINEMIDNGYDYIIIDFYLVIFKHLWYLKCVRISVLDEVFQICYDPQIRP